MADWISQQPGWLRIAKPESELQGQVSEKLGDGEREAIALALERGPDVLLLMDETKGRREAEKRQLRFMGTLGILDLGAARELIDLPSAIEKLRQTNFFVTPVLLRGLLEADAQRKKSARSPRKL